MQRKDVDVMGAIRILPPDQELIKMVDAGLTHQAIADRVSSEVGQPVSRSAVSAALHRAGASKNNHRYKDVIPWTVKTEHAGAYHVRMLRLVGRRRQQLPLNEDESQRLNRWLKELDRLNAVVAYAPHTAMGFHYVERDEADDYPDGMPIRRRLLTEAEIPSD